MRCDIISIGSGKIIVEFFSADIEFSVWKEKYYDKDDSLDNDLKYFNLIEERPGGNATGVQRVTR